jgi:hypothetical protein
MTIPGLIKALREGLNVGPDFATAIGTLAVQSNPYPLATTFDLNHLAEHVRTHLGDRHQDPTLADNPPQNFPIEHDASLSREDFYETGDDLTFQQYKFDQVLSFFQDSDTISIPVASKAKYARVQNQRALNPSKFIYGPRQEVLSYGETALYLSTMGNPTTGDAPVCKSTSLETGPSLVPC